MNLQHEQLWPARIGYSTCHVDLGGIKKKRQRSARKMLCGRCLWLGVCCCAWASVMGAGPCGDTRLAGLESMPDMTGAAPAFMQAPMEAICKKGALSAVKGLRQSRSDCGDLADLLSHESAETCAGLGKVLSNAARSHSCWCDAAELVAGADDRIAEQIMASFQELLASMTSDDALQASDTTPSAALAASTRREADTSSRSLAFVLVAVGVAAAAASRLRNRIERPLL